MLTYDEQISNLKCLKNLQMNGVEEEKIIKLYLNKYSYYNFVNSTKRFFISHKEDNKYIYLPSNTLEWINNFDKQVKVGNQILLGILEIEKELNSFLSYELTMKSRGGKLKASSREVQIIKSCLEKYGNNTYDDEELVANIWKYIPFLPLGIVFKILNSKEYSANKKLRKILKKHKIQHKEKQGVLKILRNELAHNTPLLIIMCYDDKKTRHTIKEISWNILSTESQLLNEFDDLCIASQNYLIKKSIKKDLTKK